MRIPLISRLLKRKTLTAAVASRSYPYELLVYIFQQVLHPYNRYPSSFVHEIPDDVFSPGELGSKSRRRDMLAAALVCKAWYIAAMDILYTSIRLHRVSAVKRIEKAFKRNPSFSSCVKAVTFVDETSLSFWGFIRLILYGNSRVNTIPSVSRLPRHIHRVLETCPNVDTLSIIRSMMSNEPYLPLSAYFPIHISLHHRLRVLTISDFHAASLTSIIPGIEFSVLETLQLAYLTITESSPPPIQTRFPRLRVLQISSSLFKLPEEATHDNMDVESHAFPQLESLELHFNFVDPRIEPSCLEQLNKLYILTGNHTQARTTNWWLAGHLDNIHDLTLPCQFFSESRTDSEVFKTLSLPRELRILRFMAFSSEWEAFETCARPPTNTKELKDFETSISWLLQHQESLSSDLNTIEILVSLEKPKPDMEGADAFFINLNRVAKACEQFGLVFRTVFRYVEPDADRAWPGPRGEWMIDEEIFP
ncbi:hypothetical protein NLI96_g5336 [Meripilus lineatus]|uniref:F-box domain-containing protein n=1 Tax=Meripilus lineatus TaxID=2056292 RepID=A0AAD5V3P5_9APHY|nr:hypothetical protein NLI96_g5336 [Physisporinus lineatus]